LSSKLEQLKAELREQRVLLGELLASMQRSHGGTPSFQPSKNFLALLTASLDKIRLSRDGWADLDPASRAEHPDVDETLRECQETILRILVLDRESERDLKRETGQARGGGAMPKEEDQPERPGAGSDLLARIYGCRPPADPS
jgi:hypothetical protein